MSDYPLLDTQEKAIRELERMIDRVRNGEVVEIIGIAFAPDDRYQYFGGSTMSKHRMAGALLECAILRLQPLEPENWDGGEGER
jgi:hypothetical protein